MVVKFVGEIGMSEMLEIRGICTHATSKSGERISKIRTCGCIATIFSANASLVDEQQLWIEKMENLCYWTLMTVKLENLFDTH